jgi:acetyl-CoA carboxylase biotin carboxyl carrier protein
MAEQDRLNQVSELFALMEEFQLGEAEHQSGDFRVLLKRHRTSMVSGPATILTSTDEGGHETDEDDSEPVTEAPAAPVGIPVTSPMHGIYYGSPSPTSAPFVREGDAVLAGQVVALIEAMKVFNEITATTSGTVLKLAAETGSMVEPGQPLIYVG